jgi:hypothetical protein
MQGGSAKLVECGRRIKVGIVVPLGLQHQFYAAPDGQAR